MRLRFWNSSQSSTLVMMEGCFDTPKTSAPRLKTFVATYWFAPLMRLTTAITAATPITTPRSVSTLRRLCAHKLDVAIATASERFIDRFAVVLDGDRFAVVLDGDRFAVVLDGDRFAVVLDGDRFAVVLDGDRFAVVLDENCFAPAPIAAPPATRSFAAGTANGLGKDPVSGWSMNKVVQECPHPNIRSEAPINYRGTDARALHQRDPKMQKRREALRFPPFRPHG